MPNADDTGVAPDRLTVFLSYARADQTRAEKVVSALERAGFTVQWDGLLHGGAAFAKAIEAAIIACDAVVVAWSDRKSVV